MYFQEHRRTWHGVLQKEAFPTTSTQIKRLNYTKENIEKSEAFLKDLLWTEKYKIVLFGHQTRPQVSIFWRKE